MAEVSSLPEPLPDELANLKQFCIRCEKQPFIRDGDRKNSFTSSGWSLHPQDWMTFAEAEEALQNGAKVYHDGKMQPATGIGFLVARSSPEAKRPLGGDLDCCRNPYTGTISPWAAAFLQAVLPFYTEVSPSGAGLRFFCWGHLPDELANVFGTGPQNDLSKDDKEAILTAKPKAREKISKGLPAFNGLEIYEANRHLSITGEKLEEFCFPLNDSDSTAALSEALKGFVADPATKGAGKSKPDYKSKNAGDKGRFPALDILDVIDTKGFTESGGQLFGSHPTEGSTTGRNLVVNPAKNLWAWMHDGINTGGDPWVWIACECNAIAWERAGAGVLKDADVVKRTLEYAVKRGLVSEEVLDSRQTCSSRKNALDRVDWALGYFVDSAGYTRQGGVDEKGNKTSEPVSEGYAYLDAILEDSEQNPPERYFVIRGKSISAKDEFELTSKIADFGEDRAAKKILLNMWAEDKLGGMNINVMKSLSPKPVKHIRILRRPAWVGNELVAPGLSTAEARFGYEKKVHVDFTSAGDVSAGREALTKALLAFDPKNTALLFATVLGAPIIARLWSGDRYCLFIQATTQMKKTTAVMLFMSMYGTKYSDESSLVRWGDGSTGNAAEHLAARTGPFPFLLDNYKQYTDKDPSALQRLIHAVVEGTEKDRLNRESMLRSSMEYLCTLIITGEQFPGQDAATRARIIELLWTNATNLEYLSEAQAHVEDINAFGKAWLQWLNSPHGLQVMNEYAPRFEAARLHYIKAAKDAANVGRLASNAAVVTLVWEIFNQWPEGHDLAAKFYPHLKAAIDEHIFNTEADISEQLDGRKFIDWLKAEFMVGRYYVTGRVEPVRIGTISEHIGTFNLANSKEHRELDEVLIAPEILSAKLLPAWQKATNGTRTDKKALLRQLVSLGCILYDETHKGYSVGRRIDGKKKRVYAFLGIFSEESELEPTEKEPGTEHRVPVKRNAMPAGTSGTRGTTRKDDVCLEEENSNKSITNPHKSLEEINTDNNNNINTGNTGSIGSTESTDIDFTGTKTEPVEHIKSKERVGGCGGCQAAKQAKKPDSTDTEKLRIINSDGYRTQIPLPDDPNTFVDHLFNCGEIVEFQHWKAKDLIERGIAEAVSA